MHDTIHENPRATGERSRFSVAMLVSIALHLALAWLITQNTFQAPLPKKQAPQIMDVVLVDESKPSTKDENNNAKTIANKSSKGQTANAKDNTTRAARAPVVGKKKKPSKQPKPLQPRMPKVPMQPQQKNKKNASLLTLHDEHSPALSPAKEKPRQEQKNKTPALPHIPLANLMPTEQAFAQLSRDFDREKRLKQMLSKEADIGINTREAKYAPYAQGLVRALEEQWRPGQANLGRLSQEARQVMMRVSIGINGALEGLEIIRPSPSSQLNDSAVAAVHAAAPFKPLPSSWGLERANFYFVFEVVEDRFVFRTL